MTVNLPVWRAIKKKRIVNTKIKNYYNEVRNRTLGLLDNPPDGLTLDEWKVTKELCTVLIPFEVATNAVSGDKHMTASMVIVLSEGLKNVCNQLQNESYQQRVNIVLNRLLSGNARKRSLGYHHYW